MSKEKGLEKVAKLKERVKGDYITQGVSFNKNCERQMELLAFALGESVSFSGLSKEMLAQRYAGHERKEDVVGYDRVDTKQKKVKERNVVEERKENRVNKVESIWKGEEKKDGGSKSSKSAFAGWI